MNLKLQTTQTTQQDNYYYVMDDFCKFTDISLP